MTTKNANTGSQSDDTAIYIDPALLAKLDAHVAKEGGTRQSFLNDLLRDYDDSPMITEVHNYTLTASANY